MDVSNVCSSFSLTFSLLLLFSDAAKAESGVTQVETDSNEIYRIDSHGKRHQIFRASRKQSLLDSSLSVSPDSKWALIDFVPSNPGPGRVEEIRMLVSLESGKAMYSESFNAKYHAWLDELARWDANKPATIILEGGKAIPIH